MVLVFAADESLSLGMFFGSRISEVSVQTPVCVFSLRVRCSSFFRFKYGFHNFLRGKVYLLSLGVRRIGFRNFKTRFPFYATQVYVGGPFGDFLALFFDLVFMLIFDLVLGAFWDAFGAQNGAQNRPQDGQKGVLEPTSEKH